MVIGGETADPSYLFSGIISPRVVFAYLPGIGTTRGPLRLPAGTIVVGQARPPEVRFFDASGRYLHTALGEGEGPTEMRRLSELHHCGGGRLLARDQRRNLVLEIDGEGQLLDSFSLRAEIGRDLYPGITCNERGQILGMDWGDSLRREDDELVVDRPPVHVWLLDREAPAVHDLGEFPGAERMDFPGPTGRSSEPYPFGKRTVFALGADRAFIGTADAFEVEVWSLDGALLERWRRPSGDARPREDDFASYVSVDREFGEGLRMIRQHLPTFALPETYPAYTRFVLDATGHLWVEHFRTPREPLHVWSVFAPEGVWLGEVEVPSRFEITDIGDDYVLGVARDELGEQAIRRYGLVRD